MKNHTFAVQIIQRIGNVTDDKAGFPLTQMPTTFDVGKQCTSIHFVKDQVKAVLLFKILHQIQNMLIHLANVEDLNLLEHLASRKAIALFYHLETETVLS